MKLINSIQNNKYFFIPYFILLLLSICVCASVDKKVLHLRYNIYHSNFFDFFFKYITSLGEEKIIIPAIILIFILSHKRIAIMALLSYAVAGISTQLLKRFVFDDMKRPSVLLQDSYLHFVEGVELVGKYSFPSGHTSVAFAFFTSLVLNIMKGRLQQILCLVLALLVALSKSLFVSTFLSRYCSWFNCRGMLCYSSLSYIRQN